MADLTKPIRIPMGGEPAGPPASPGAGGAAPKPTFGGYEEMFSPSHFVNGVRTNKAPY